MHHQLKKTKTKTNKQKQKQKKKRVGEGEYIGFERDWATEKFTATEYKLKFGHV